MTENKTPATRPDRHAPGQRHPAPARPAPAWQHPPVPSEQLMCGCKLLEINHKGTIYRLQVTRQDKLILTK